MGWVKLFTNFYRHPKALAAGPQARNLYIAAMAWAGEFNTDGLVPAYVLETCSTDAGVPPAEAGTAADRLVEVSLWERVPDGWQIHDWADWQTTSDERSLKLEQARKRKAKWKAARSKETTSGDTTGNAAPNAFGTHSERSSEAEAEAEVEESLSSAVADDEPKPTQAEIDATNPDAVRLAALLALFLAEEFGPSKDYQPDRWVPDVAKLLRIDGEDPASVERCLRWIFKSESLEGAFWRPNIRSGAKLRAQFGQLRDKRKAELDRAAAANGAKQPPPTAVSWSEQKATAAPMTDEEHQAWLAERAAREARHAAT